MSLNEAIDTSLHTIFISARSSCVVLCWPAYSQAVVVDVLVWSLGPGISYPWIISLTCLDSAAIQVRCQARTRFAVRVRRLYPVLSTVRAICSCSPRCICCAKGRKSDPASGSLLGLKEKKKENAHSWMSYRHLVVSLSFVVIVVLSLSFARSSSLSCCRSRLLARRHHCAVIAVALVAVVVSFVLW